MLLVAVVGDPGDGKTSLLARIAAHEISEGREVEGFLAIAGDRPDPAKGAESYSLQWLATGEFSPFATRDESVSPPYRIDAATTTMTLNWAASMAQREKIELVMFDEFSKFEAQGEGHMALWPAIVAANPKVVLIAIRSSCLEAISERLGRGFDEVISTSDPDAENRIHEILAVHREWVRVGTFGAASGGIEASLGAYLHAAQIPFAGFGLVAIQCGVLTYAAHDLARRERVSWISLISAGLKALSPAGSRVRPMLAISVQGALYGLAVRTFGWNRIGVFVAGGLAGSWAAMQGFLMQWLFVGSDLFKSYAWLQKQVAGWGIALPNLGVAIAILALFSAALSAGVSSLVYGRRDRFVSRVERTLASNRRLPHPLPPPQGEGKVKRAILATLRDLVRPTFWIPVALIVALALVSGKSSESAVFIVLRAVAIAAVLFALIHFVDVAKMVGLLRKKGHWGPAAAFEEAIPTNKR